MNRELLGRIQSRSANLAVIGLGYVGLPVAALFARAGFDVVGIDVVEKKISKINSGISPIEGQEPGLADLLKQVVSSGKFRATKDYTACQNADCVFIAVETPVDEVTKKPDYVALRGALASLGQNLKRGALVIVESTIAPRTMQDVVLPTIESTSGLKANADFFLVHCPERLTPGKLILNIETMARVVGGMTRDAAEIAATLYRYVVKGELDLTDCLTAELVKTTENAYRDVQIAFANEVALVCEAVGGNVWQVRELVNKSPGRHMLLPGAGVGGHCIPKDPWLLIANAEGVDAPLIRAARRVNDSMPLHIADLVVNALREAGKEIRGARIAVLGYAYLENSDDTRNSPSAALIARLNELGAEVRVHDPYVSEYSGDLMETLRGMDCAVLMVAHDEYRQLDFGAMKKRMRASVIVDGRNEFDAAKMHSMGFVFLQIGQAE
ncbi:MAG: nucleotide sugar dehydrogenase [Chloroflexi bacterium]|nr:nucleotide sugar dehydrogenase [Chloroflexota bacterium]